MSTEGTLLFISFCPSYSLFLNPSFSPSSSSAVIEHTNKVIYLEDDDVASVDNEGGKHSRHHIVFHTYYTNVCYFIEWNLLTFSSVCSPFPSSLPHHFPPPVLSIHHVKRSNKAVATQREVHTLKMKLQEIMKGVLSCDPPLMICFLLYHITSPLLPCCKDHSRSLYPPQVAMTTSCRRRSLNSQRVS